MSNTMKILSLGAGVQSTALYLMACEGRIHIDMAVFADTQSEPLPVYKHLEYLINLGGPTIHIVTAGSLKSKIMSPRKSILIPAFTKNMDGIGYGKMLRVCTSDFKLVPIMRFVNKVCNSKPCVIICGISLDEAGRAFRIKQRALRDGVKHEYSFPLIDMKWSRRDCEDYLRDRVPHQVPKSACTFCPFRTNASWRWLKKHDPDGWKEAVFIDRFLRTSKKTKLMPYLHRSCVPLDEADIDDDTSPQMKLNLFGENECTGMCGL